MKKLNEILYSENYLYKDIKTGEIFAGDELMNVGITIERVKQDFYSKKWIFKAIG